jgi:hypothetical protein
MKPRHIVIVAAICLASTTALAEETVVPTDSQQDYNDKGVVLMQQGDYAGAVASFRASLSLGNLNVTQLNLGRAYFRQNLCLDARNAYEAVDDAPKVNAPTPAEIATLLERFENEYAETCSARLAFECQGNPNIVVGRTEPRACEALSDGWPVMAGPVKARVMYPGADAFEIEVEATSGTVVSVPVGPPTDEDVVAAAPVVTDTAPGASVAASDDGGSSLATYGWVTLGIGGALVAGALVYDQVVTGAAVDELEGLDNSEIDRADELRSDIEGHQTNSIVLLGVGSAAVITGVVLLLLPDGDDAGPTAWISTNSAGVVYQGRF